jgi:hypothetical protein
VNLFAEQLFFVIAIAEHESNLLKTRILQVVHHGIDLLVPRAIELIAFNSIGFASRNGPVLCTRTPAPYLVAPRL